MIAFVQTRNEDARTSAFYKSFCLTGSRTSVHRRVSLHAVRGLECDKLSPGVRVAQHRVGDFEVGAPYGLAVICRKSPPASWALRRARRMSRCDRRTQLCRRVTGVRECDTLQYKLNTVC
ncbi:hypothetical protein LSAT2_027087 [Lamellibrachia satsuma]|nr:hypothetical protein LSAT2_027087 [Lamellibrachia satsuma]